jgi:hypothetical protein
VLAITFRRSGGRPRLAIHSQPLNEQLDAIDQLMIAKQAVYAGPSRGDEGNRTPNPRLAKAVLCQLSYVPGSAGRYPPGAGSGAGQLLVASCQRSSWRELRTLENTNAPAARPMTTASSFFIDSVLSGCRFWQWAQLDLNQRPRRYQRRALTN